MRTNLARGLLAAGLALLTPLAAAHEGRFSPQPTRRWEFGVVITAADAPALGVVATVPVPSDWEEQTVKVVSQDVSSAVKRVTYREVDGGARQMVVQIPKMAKGDTAYALVTFEIAKQTVLAPRAPLELAAAKTVPAQLRDYLAPSPGIETTHPKIRAAAKEAAGDKTLAWERAEAIYDWTRSKVRYQEGEFRGALAALASGQGDCEELTSLFVALCRVNGVPARSVWVPGHCYPEFYLEDAAGAGVWIPCQAAGEREFGGMRETRPILQKGDSFKLPELRERVRYAQASLKSENRGGSAQPRIEVVMRPVE